MEIEQKKFLAEWMGVLKGGGNLFPYQIYGLHIDSWNPDTNHKQFAEVWGKLDGDYKYDIMSKVATPIEPFYSYSMMDIVLNDLPKVMQAVLNVLKEGK